MAGWGLDEELLGGSGVLPAYPRRPPLSARLAEAWRILVTPSPASQLPARRAVAVKPTQRLAQPGY